MSKHDIETRLAGLDDRTTDLRRELAELRRLPCIARDLEAARVAEAARIAHARRAAERERELAERAERRRREAEHVRLVRVRMSPDAADTTPLGRKERLDIVETTHFVLKRPGLALIVEGSGPRPEDVYITTRAVWNKLVLDDEEVAEVVEREWLVVEDVPVDDVLDDYAKHGGRGVLGRFLVGGDS
jgi:hypothetical protein